MINKTPGKTQIAILFYNRRYIYIEELKQKSVSMFLRLAILIVQLGAIVNCQETMRDQKRAGGAHNWFSSLLFGLQYPGLSRKTKTFSVNEIDETENSRIFNFTAKNIVFRVKTQKSHPIG